MNKKSNYNGNCFIFNITSYDVNNGILRICYSARLNNRPTATEAIMTLWIHNVCVNGTLSENLIFLSNIDFVKEGVFEIDCSKHIPDKAYTSCDISFEIALDKNDETVDRGSLSFSVDFGELNEAIIYQLFLNANHKNKSHDNLNKLSQIIAKAYLVSPELANRIWNILWEENRSLPGLQKRYFILVIFRGLLPFLGTSDAVDLLLMEEYRLRLILEYDSYGTDDVLKDLCKYYISHSKFKSLINTLNLYQIINNIGDTNAIENERLCSIVYQVINPNDNINGQQLSGDDLQGSHCQIKDNQIIEFCNFLKDNYCTSTLYYLLLGYETCIRKQPLLNLEIATKCLNVLTVFSVRETIVFLVLHEPYLDKNITNSALRKTVTKHDLFFRHGLDILENQKQWFKDHILSKEVFLGFFEKRKCMLADFEFQIILDLVKQRNWETLKECFLLIGTNADSCRLGSLLSFVSDSIQSYSPKVETSTLKVGILEIEMEYSITCGRKYNEFLDLVDQDMKNYRDVLLCLKTVISDRLRETDKLLKSIAELEEKLI